MLRSQAGTGMAPNSGNFVVFRHAATARNAQPIVALRTVLQVSATLRAVGGVVKFYRTVIVFCAVASPATASTITACTVYDARVVNTCGRRTVAVRAPEVGIVSTLVSE